MQGRCTLVLHRQPVLLMVRVPVRTFTRALMPKLCPWHLVCLCEQWGSLGARCSDQDLKTRPRKCIIVIST